MYKTNEIIRVTITNITHYGFFFECEKKWKGLVHISEISDKYVYNIRDHFEIGKEVDVAIMEIDKTKNQIKASYKAANKIELSSKNFNSPEEFQILKDKLPTFIKMSTKKK